MSADEQGFAHLGRAGRITAAVARRPRLAVHAAVGGAVLLSWLLIATMALRSAAVRTGPAGAPGDGLLSGLFDVPLPAFLESFLALCLQPTQPDVTGPFAFLALAAMWFMMALAMMLPSAAPMIRTYCEIADTASRKDEEAVHPLVLVAGYLTVWLLAALGFAGLTSALQSYRSGGVLDPVLGPAGAAALGLAGLYQFSGLKEACLEKCRNPFAILFARWTVRPTGVFRLGLEQGVWCLGCCWALMLVMLAVGAMNIFWMALLALFTLVEKQTEGRLATRLAGAILLVWATALLLVSA